MTDTFRPDLSGFQSALSGAEAALADFAQGPARAAADGIAENFERAGRRIATALSGAGADGERTMKRLAKVILEELARVALDKIFSSAAGSLPFFGARAAGGSVTRGGAYLVGENGPELFTPAGAGALSGAGGGGVNVHFHLSGGADAQSIARHQGQIAAQIARAVAYGRRNL
ncbi:MAG: phage tail tape measure protein [Hyphomonadaceae bacterium]